MTSIQHARAIIFIQCALISHTALAADAGSLQRDINRHHSPVAPAQPVRQETPSPEQARHEETVTISRFIVEGATLIPVDELEALIADLTGKPLNMSELDNATLRIANLYRARGWFVRVWLPEQEIRNGSVRIAVLEGKLSSVRVEGGKDSPDLAFAGRVVASHLKIGEILTTAGLERGLLLANDLPGVIAAGVLEPGARVGETALNVKVEPGRTLNTGIFYNNHGYRSTGHHQLGVSAAIAPGSGNLIKISAQSSGDIDLIDLGFSTPLGTDGARLALGASRLKYDLEVKPKSPGLMGNAVTYSASVSWPWVRSENANLLLTGDLSRKDYEDQQGAATYKERTLKVLGLEMAADRTDQWAEGGKFDAGIRLVLGNLDLGNAGDRKIDSRTMRSQGGYAKLGGRLSRMQLLGQSTSLLIAASGQVAGKNLNSSEKFSPGGPYGIRAYPVGEAAGDDGWLLNLELRRELGEGWRAAAFADATWTRVNHHTWPGSDTPGSYHLYGAGLSLNWQRSQGMSFDAAVAVPIGSNPGGEQNNINQDGSERGPRLWVTFRQSF